MYVIFEDDDVSVVFNDDFYDDLSKRPSGNLVHVCVRCGARLGGMCFTPG
jgi:hypothetical protein